MKNTVLRGTAVLLLAASSLTLTMSPAAAWGFDQRSFGCWIMRGNC